MKRILLLMSAALLSFACSKPQPQEFHVIPMPADVSLTQGSFNVAGAQISCDEGLDERSLAAVSRFADALKTLHGRKRRNPLRHKPEPGRRTVLH